MKRNEIPEEYKWNIKAMYADDDKWEKDFARSLKLAEKFKSFSGKLGGSAATLLSAFKESDRIWRLTENVYIYAELKNDEDTADAVYQAFSSRAHTLFSKVTTCMSFFTPEFLAIPTKKIDEFIKKEKGLLPYSHAIDEMRRQKKHILSKKEENILAQLSDPLGATGEIFNMIDNADMKFSSVNDESGDRVEITHANYFNLMRSSNRKVRKNTYERYYDAYNKQRNTIATTFSFSNKKDAARAAIRGYGSSLEARLYPENIPVSVYENLIKAVNENLDLMHRYIDIRRKSLGLNKLHMYDNYVPLFSIKNENLRYEKAVEMMYEALAPLGSEYINQVKKGIEHGWIDVFENKGKQSGAYSSGTYDSYPYILLNYADRIEDAFTLVHEMGHSMHSFYTNKAQPYRYSEYSIFAAEVASTVNESLFFNYLIETRPKKDDQRYFINMYLDQFKATVFRQTMFAEFEKLTHDAIEGGEALTAEYLCEEYGKLNTKYFGSNVITDERIKMEWARIPHFYSNFYVYQYATGCSAATAISNRILTEGKRAASDYIGFLKSGGSDYPIETLKIAGVDMSQPEPVESALKVFGALLNRLEELM